MPASIQAPKTRFYSPMAHSCYEIDVDALNGRPVAQALPDDLQSLMVSVEIGDSTANEQNH